MSPHMPVEDPSRGSSLLDQTAVHVRSSLLLRVLLAVTLVNTAATLVLAVLHRINIHLTATVILLSTLAWFFAVGLPVMNREVRLRVSGSKRSYVSDLIEMFYRVVLGALTLLWTAMLVYAALQG